MRKWALNRHFCRFGTEITETALLDKIEDLNNDDDVDGFIVQLPLPAHISENKVIEAIDPQKMQMVFTR